jgi:hypothetical protein
MNINVHIDCDPLWVYGNEYGVAPDYRDSSIYESALPAFLELFREFNVKATFFIIGRDLGLPSCVRFCTKALRAGHALGNHTFSHLQDYRTLSLAWKREEIFLCHDAVRRQLGYECKGFRCPGYYFDCDIAAILRALDYRYDSSVLPGVGVHLMKLSYGLFNAVAKGKRFGRPSYLFGARSPRLIGAAAGERCLWEFPIATYPFLMLPIHSTFVFRWGRRYFNAALALSRWLRSHLVYLFHAIDLLDERAAGALASKVGTLKGPLTARQETMRSLLTALSRHQVSLTEDWPEFPQPVGPSQEYSAPAA